MLVVFVKDEIRYEKLFVIYTILIFTILIFAIFLKCIAIKLKIKSKINQKITKNLAIVRNIAKDLTN